MSRLVITRLLAVLAAVFLVAGCASDSDDSSGGESSESSGTGAAAATLTVTDAWIKAVPADGHMTAVFAKIENSSEEAITIESATTDMSDRTELHHMVMKDGSMVMAPIPGGIEVPANDTVSLEPGGLHIMVMDLTTEVAVGAEHEITLTLSNGEEVTFTAVAKDFAGGNENYDPNGGMDHGNMSEGNTDAGNPSAGDHSAGMSHGG